MLTASNTPRRHAVRALVASGLALFGLSQAFDAGAAKKARAAKKKNKTKQGPPGPPGPQGPPGSGTLALKLGNIGAFANQAGGQPTNADGHSDCPAGSVAVGHTFELGNPLCTVMISERISPPNAGWTMRVHCPANEFSGNEVIAICLEGATTT